MYQSSRNCFEENLRLFSNPQTDPENFNLYTGLLNFVDAVERDMGIIKHQNSIITELLQRIR